MSTALAFLTIVHVNLSLVAIAAGLVVAYALLKAMRLDRWTMVFFGFTIAMTATGPLFSIQCFMPALGIGIASLLVLPVAMFALYLNTFVLVAQAFLNLPALNALPPTQTEPPFVAAQVAVLASFITMTVLAVRRFHVEPATAQRAAARIA